MFIQFGLINYKFIIQLLYPLFYHLRFRIGGDRNNCFQLFLNYSSYSLAGVIYLIVKYRTKETKRENKENRYRINHDNGELVFEWGIEAFREYETEATKFINEQGYDFLSTSEENVKKAVEEYNQLTKEQKNQAIVELSESIIIKLDYYNLF